VKITQYRTRIYIKVWLNGKLYSSTIKSRVLDFAQRELFKKRSPKGTCRVSYDTKHDLWNEFEFKSLNELKFGLQQDLERPLLNYIQDGLEKGEW
jgi:hypothetical protein